MSPNLALFILVVIFVVGGFALGTHRNVRRGHDAMRWVQDGLPLVGEKTTLRWLRIFRRATEDPERQAALPRS